ncbi:MAG: hypothetical protein UX09_C0018G0019 [Candidatus Uhrbacteria bacterium GW2011_GWE2_45_35]|uniref:Uncharacterized protein n=2 Tax=Candidatus Uhriibacteriota TaxID=1752732 RepID=A0A0G1JK44_9BACT|nr:MAG: hypothetical protein UW63_C0010G0011 [Candidatus Uhrbacteria bacterium GW2011_GWF2_44_350]KKU08392.1 MAG: hypothetical protein UX09_C0018G0019 [Candidatus Uhrbacteria bacterium GW2011_GWE2_45_35]HBR80513.1 hypothetical protein [Candidatus Uhrbacteria bacterium]HCU31709.1 hypothetical protein [Candidatus Uhrbacteria bacterium]
MCDDTAFFASFFNPDFFSSHHLELIRPAPIAAEIDEPVMTVSIDSVIVAPVEILEFWNPYLGC